MMVPMLPRSPNKPPKHAEPGRRFAKLDTNPALRREVIRLFTHKHSTRVPLHSPQTVARRLKNRYPEDKSMTMSHEALYQAIYIQGAGSLRQELKLEKALRSGRTSRLPRSPLAGMKHTRAGKSWVRGAEIALRDTDFPDAAAKLVPGHWEGDLVIGGDGKSALVTLVERSSRYVLIRRLADNHESKTVTEMLTEMVASIAYPRVWKSLTWDQGVEMAKYETYFKVDADFKVYFADPHAPWQRGANEQTNKLIREFFPKGTNFGEVTDQEVAEVEEMLNDRARMVLDGATPFETLADVISGALTA